MNCAMRCLRQHFWQFEIGLRKIEVGLALRVGSAWARGMAARWNGFDYDGALAAAIPEGVNLDAYTCATVGALLAGYYDYYGPIEDMGKLHPEQKFGYELGLGFTVEGILDGIGQMVDNLTAIVEGKTTGDSLAPDSDYWLRLAFNMQIYQYVLAARHDGWDIAKVFYDVTRKPSIRPKEVDDLDAAGLKIVRDREGKRVMLLAGKNKGQPRQSGDAEKGYVIQSHIETPDEFSNRLWRDTLERPSFYFARREIAVIDDQLESFERQRMAIAKLILSIRASEIPCSSNQHIHGDVFARDADAWPRNVSENTCNFCAYKSFCLQNLTVDVNHPPAGFKIEPFNPELHEHDTATEEIASATV